MARVKFSRGLRANINKLHTNKTATEGSLYFATDDGTLWYGNADGTLTQVRDNINTTYSSLKNPYSLTIQGNGTTLTNGTYDGSSAKTVNITPSSIGAATSGHTHSVFSGSANGFAPSTASGNLSTTDVTTSQYVLTNDGKWHTLPDNAWKNDNTNTNTTYKISKSGSTITLTGSDGSTTTVSDSDHTYTLASLGGITPSEVDSKISTAVAAAYKYKGSVSSDKLPTSGQVTGDVYNLTNDSAYGKAGMNVAWNGSAWDALGSNVDLSAYALKSSIPTVSNSTITIKQTGRADQTFTLNGGATTISLNDNNTWTAMTGATPSAAGGAGYVPAPAAGAANRYLRSDGTWAVPPDNDTHKTWGLSINGHTVSIVDGGSTKSITVPDNDTTNLASMTGTLSVAHGGTGQTNLDNVTVGVANRIGLYASAHKETASGSTANAPSAGMATGEQGLYLTSTYSDNTAMPTTYGNVINIVGDGTGQLLAGWSGTDNTTAKLYYRSHRDTSTGGWGPWKTVAYMDDIPTVPTSLPANGGTASNVSGTVAVNHGGTGVTSIASGQAIIGNGTGNVTTRAITDVTAVGPITGYNTNLMTTNTLAFWNGSYNTSGTSNLTYCKNGTIASTDIIVVSSTQPDASKCKLWIKA